MVWLLVLHSFFLFFFNDTATTEIYTLSLHDALPISSAVSANERRDGLPYVQPSNSSDRGVSEEMVRCSADKRSEEHTSELQSQSNLVCRLLLEKKQRSN